ncbi:MAG: hypothetical protein WKG07_25135 [Hymenobacter sp.]
MPGPGPRALVSRPLPPCASRQWRRVRGWPPPGVERTQGETFSAGRGPAPHPTCD